MEFRSPNLKHMIIRYPIMEFIESMKLASFVKQALGFIEQIAAFISSSTFVTFVKIAVGGLMGQSSEFDRIEGLKKQ